MNGMQVNGFVYALTHFLLVVSSIYVCYMVNPFMAVVIGGLAIMNSIAKNLFILEQSSQDEELLRQLEELVKKKSKNGTNE